MKKLWIVLLVLIVAVGMVACSAAQPAGGSDKAAGAKDTSDQVYIEIVANAGEEYFDMHKAGLEAAGEFFGVKTEYVGPLGYDMDQVISDFEQAIGKKPNGILCVGWEDAMTPVINKAVAAGIPVVTVDADLPDSDRVAFVGTSNFDAGVVCGTNLAELIGGEGKVAILGKSTLSNILARVDGCVDAWEKKYPNIEYIGLIESGAESNTAAANLAAVIQANPDLKGVCSVDSEAGAGAIMAIREAGLAGQIKCISFDRGSEILAAIEEGVISATIVQQTNLMPFYAVNILYNMNNYTVVQTKDDKAAGMPGIPSYIDTGVTICNKDNVALFKTGE
jgi:ribose transport system substrate-binding protein